jgi:hypothetical protein
MKKTLIATTALALLCGLPALAANPVRMEGEKPLSPGEVTATPDMWFYQQYMRQYQDPKVAVRKNAEFRADQRMRRLAAMRWFGFSNTRPQASVDPQDSDYSPRWTSNDGVYPERWSGVGHPAVILLPDGSPRAY